MNSVEKTIQILNCLSDTDGKLGVTEISSKLSIPKSTVHRILKSLMKYSLVSKDLETSKYRLGIQLLRYAHSFYSSFDLREYSKDILKRISENTGLTTFLSIWQDDNGICIDSVSSSHKLGSRNLFVEVGKIMPYHCAAASKILLAYQSPEEISRVVNSTELKRYTSKTITEPETLIIHFKKIQTQGYAICDEELEEGIRAISAPIKNVNGKIEASITVVGLLGKVPVRSNSFLIQLVVAAGNEISKLIG